MWTAAAHRIAGSSRATSMHIRPPGNKAMVQMGRFGIQYETGGKQPNTARANRALAALLFLLRHGLHQSNATLMLSCKIGVVDLEPSIRVSR